MPGKVDMDDDAAYAQTVNLDVPMVFRVDAGDERLIDANLHRPVHGFGRGAVAPIYASNLISGNGQTPFLPTLTNSIKFTGDLSDIWK